MRRLLAVAALAALALCASAAAHNTPGGKNPYASSVTKIVPSVPGIFAGVLGQDDRLWIDNAQPRTLVVLGYQGEPYLRFDRTNVYRNVNSPATYVNSNRFGAAPVPSTVNADAKPIWRRVSTRRMWQWHDHRIHWMSTIPPSVVRADPTKPHHVFNWRVPILVGGKKYAIVGTLDYVPLANTAAAPVAADGSTVIPIVVAGVLTLLATVGGFVAYRVLRRRPVA